MASLVSSTVANTVVQILQLHNVYIRNVVVSKSKAHSHLCACDGNSW